MSESYCPICFTSLETREVAPCYDCGHDPEELVHLAERRHTYDELETLGARVILCNFCQSDFSSYDPTYFGLPRGTRIGRAHMQLVHFMILAPAPTSSVRNVSIGSRSCDSLRRPARWLRHKVRRSWPRDPHHC